MTPEIAEHPWGRGARRAIWLGVVWVLMCANAVWPYVRFTSSFLNFAVFAVAQWIPWLLLYFIFQWRTPRWRKWLWGVPVLLLTLLSAPFGLMSAACALVNVDGDPTIERREELPTPGGTVVVYYIDTGAVGYWGYHVRQQCTILPGVLAVHYLYRTPDHGKSAQVEPLDFRRVRITASYYAGFQHEERSIVTDANLWPLPCLWSRSG